MARRNGARTVPRRGNEAVRARDDRARVPGGTLTDDERDPTLLALAVLADEFRESGHDAVVALFDALAGAITRDEVTLH